VPYNSRSLRFNILPPAFRGILSTKITNLGALNPESVDLHLKLTH
jgi:hypothetical protein